MDLLRKIHAEHFPFLHMQELDWERMRSELPIKTGGKRVNIQMPNSQSYEDQYHPRVSDASAQQGKNSAKLFHVDVDHVFTNLDTGESRVIGTSRETFTP